MDDIKATRFGAKYDFGKVIVGGLFEHITDDLPGGGSGALDRNAYGANVTYKLTGNTKLMAQVLKVGDYGNTNKTGATRFALGASQKVNSNLDFYAVYAQTNNDKNAAFPGTGHDHGDRLFTVAGKDPKAFSVGRSLQVLTGTTRRKRDRTRRGGRDAPHSLWTGDGRNGLFRQFRPLQFLRGLHGPAFLLPGTGPGLAPARCACHAPVRSASTREK